VDRLLTLQTQTSRANESQGQARPGSGYQGNAEGSSAAGPSGQLAEEGHAYGYQGNPAHNGNADEGY